ncbi:MAG: RdgB/HAM1 family non-canonical purine NTP pyrophosphatase [Erysipelotrichaceae bacterium]|nr:RdgB/HAM1 family non-canonical purine NTP pyrophosphatase [Erysipelotrichaceae bacterium]
MKQFVLASGNKNKFKEFELLLRPLKIKLISISELGISLDGVSEDGKTYAENALIKANAVAKHTSLPIIADDSGLSINALDGFPGLNSDRFLFGESAANKNDAVINLMENVSDRSASFFAAIALINYQEEPLVFIGEAKGEILKKQVGSHGFGYDPIFYSFEANKPFALLSDEEKNAVSHRGKAVKKLLDYLSESA